MKLQQIFKRKATIKSSRKSQSNDVEKSEVKDEHKLLKSQTIGLWISVAISLFFSAISFLFTLKSYVESEREKCVIDISLVKDDYDTAWGTRIFLNVDTFQTFFMFFNATITNISKNPISIVEYKSFGPYITDSDEKKWIDFDPEKLPSSFENKNFKLNDPIRIEPGEFYRFKFRMMIWTDIKKQLYTPEEDIISLLDSIYVNKTDFFGNEIDYSLDEEGYVTGYSYNLENSHEIKHHFVLKTAKGNFLIKDVNWYNNSNLGLDILKWVFDPEGELEPLYMY